MSEAPGEFPYVKVKFVGQPYRHWPCGASFIAEALADPTVTRLVILTAWVRKSGIGLIEPRLRELRERGGRVELYAGVDLKGTSIQGLELAQSAATSVKVVHDPEGRTFHPKVYLATGGKTGYALVGSNNLTAGGMAYNYEGAVQLSFPSASNSEFISALDLLLRRLDEDTAICKRLSPVLKRRLIAEGWLADEVDDRHYRDEDRTKRHRKGAGGLPSLFGKSRFAKRFAPPPLGGGRESEKGAVRGRGERRAAGVSRPLVDVPDSWWKRLGRGDAQRPPQGNLTHLVRLTDVPEGVGNRARYFRSVFFRTEIWERRRDSEGNRLEVATVKVKASIAGKDVGEREIEIDYGKHRDDRGRATTVLHWGELLPEVLAQDLTGHFLLIERGQGSYVLSITPEKPV
jgi:hypothetical protein